MTHDITEITIHNVIDLHIGVDSEKRNPCLVIDTGSGKHFIHPNPSDQFAGSRILRTINAFNAIVSEEIE